jgi:1-phosphofructokinase family hexose kinase
MIHVFSPNTAHEVILGVARLGAGDVHRAMAGHRRVGGKGVNVARACGRMGVPVRVVAIADARGADDLLREPDLVDATIELVPLDGDARTDVIIAESDGRATVVNGIGDPLPAGLAERAADRLLGGVAPGDLVVLAGSLPRGAPAGLYASIVSAVGRTEARTIVDASGPWLLAALEARPDICKVNLRELADALGQDAGRCWREGGSLVPSARALVLSDAARGARVWSEATRCSIRVPRQTVVNGVGAGDAMTAGIATGLAAGLRLADAAARGAAWGAAAVRELDLTLEPAVADAIADEVRVTGCRRT